MPFLLYPAPFDDPPATNMGFNPFRPHTKSTTDIALVIGAILLTLAVVAWALFGG